MEEGKFVIEPKQDKLFGVLVRSTADHANIKSISIPKTDDEVFVVSGNDFGDFNWIRVVDSQYPILATNEVKYLGQPILAIFSYDNETSRLLADDVKIEYEKLENVSNELPDYSVQWGDPEKIMSDESLKKVSGLYYFGQQSTQEHSILKVKAYIMGSVIAIECPTQWPFHVKNTVSRVMGVTPDQVRINVKTYYSPKDEYLVNPSFLAAIAAVAAKKGGCPAEISTTYPVFKPELVISRTSAIDSSGNVVAESILANADLGAYPLFSDEIAIHMLCGLIPIYPVPNLSIKTSLFCTSKVPSNFFGTLGFSDCLCSSEVQVSKIATEIGDSPVTWRLEHIGPNPEYTKRLSTDNVEFLKQSIREITEASGFQRKYFAFQQQRTKKNKLNSLLNYARGIGLACGPGINGFSTHFKDLPHYSVKMTLDSSGKIIVNTSFPPKSYVNTIWSDFVSKKMKIQEDDISFESPLSADIVNSGPDVLSRNIGNISDLIINACDSISARRFKEPLPLSAQPVIQMDESRPMFGSHVWAAVVVELEIDPVMIVPVVKKCWVNTNFEVIYDQAILESKMRRVIESTITELGGRPDPEMEDIIVFHSQKEGKASSVNQALKGALSAAFTSALSQAINVEQIKLPVSSEYLLEVIKGQ